MYSNMI